MKPQRSMSINPKPDDLVQILQQHAKLLAGNVTFGTSIGNNDQGRNINGWQATFTTPGTPNTPFNVSHGLNRIPLGYLIFTQSAAGTLIKTGTWTASMITLECTTASVTFTIFII